MAATYISARGVNSKRSSTIGSRAFVTFLAGGGDYVKGVIGLAKGLRKVKSLYPLVVAVLPDVPVEHLRLLAEQGCILKPVDWVQPPQVNKNQMEWIHPHFTINYSKLRIFQFEEYNKMVYLDGDIQVYGNCDELFELADGYFYAVLDCFCDWYYSPQYKIGYCQQSPDRVAWPADEMGSRPCSYFNAGMFVFEPSQATYNQLVETIENIPPTPFAEQDLLNYFTKAIFKPIPPMYNLMVSMLWQHPDKVDVNCAKVVHFCATGSKPWRFTGEEDNMKREDVKMLVEKWWDIYNDASLDFTKSSDHLPANYNWCGLKTQQTNFSTDHQAIIRPSQSAV